FQLLLIFCRKCSRLLVKEELLKSKEKISINEIMKNLEKVCPHCKEKQKEIRFLKPHTYFEGEEQLTPDKIRERFEKIKNEDLKKIGLKIRPEWFILSVLLVPPITVRPSITLETGERSEDDLTHKLVEIVRTNERLKENIELGSPQFIIDDLWELLQYNVSTYFDNELAGVPPARHRSGRVLKGISQRLKTKEGRFRGNLAGKRVNFSARTVISPDPYILIDEVGVPEEIAKELTIPEFVREENIDELRRRILNGPNVWPGANYIITPNGRRKKITESNKEEIANEIQSGYIVERHLINGDIVLFNRQPSLHKMSMMAHRVKVMPGKTFRLSLSTCPPYNADFDGDEMNLHVPQTEEARVESEILAGVLENVISPRYNRPIIGLRQDFITGLYLLTTSQKKFSREEVIDLVKSIDITINIPNKENFDGKEVFSLFLPRDLSLEFRSKTGEKVIIKNGNLESGPIDKAAVGAESGILLYFIYNKYGKQYFRDFLSKISLLSMKFLMSYGFSIGISDFNLPRKVKEEIIEMIKKEKKEINNFIQTANERDAENIISRRINNLLNRVNEFLTKLKIENNTTKIARCGARGDMINFLQTVGLIGQERIMGERIMRGYRGRTLPHFKVGDNSLEARGFVDKGFRDGLNPFEFFFDASNSRESLMDKSVKTRVSGYMERRLINALQDLKVAYDGTVIDTEQRIIQFEPLLSEIDIEKRT
ncbi:MAG: DNA-directed RNA polymerase subunit A', partial [Candidatus Aenigmarchaeota archaeon]|nr:DNA-directed RNA polymerase subunit A' [Candidatus Aenigmarchaeota archaeon]MDW8149154.1 DNA-directed RNA polymerase subunit A' [Candidatus Aenigmarchaeota archaeon]